MNARFELTVLRIFGTHSHRFGMLRSARLSERLGRQDSLQNGFS